MPPGLSEVLTEMKTRGHPNMQGIDVESVDAQRYPAVSSSALRDIEDQAKGKAVLLQMLLRESQGLLTPTVLEQTCFRSLILDRYLR